MIRTSIRARSAAFAACVLVFVLAPVTAAQADTTIDGPIDLGDASPYSVIGGATVTNTGPTSLAAGIALSPGTDTPGFPPGVVLGTTSIANADAVRAQNALTSAYNVAASLTPAETGLGELTGLSLAPGVYSGGELGVSGELVLDGDEDSFWVFQAASTLTVGSGAVITMTGGASACNVFWQVSSSATIGTAAQFAGIVMADQDINAFTGATITGRLLARIGQVVLDTNEIIEPTGCATTFGTVSTSPEITSEAPPSGERGADYSYTITSSGTPDATYAVTGGSLPAGLELNAETGEISGTPTESGTYTFEITASNGTSPDAVESYSLTIADAAVAAVVPGLAESGADVVPALLGGAAIGLAGFALVMYSRWRTSLRPTRG